MANAGRVHTFANHRQVGALVANTIAWAGDVYDLNVGYAKYGATPTRQNRDYGPGRQLFVNFKVDDVFDLGSRRVNFVVGSFTSAAFAGAREVGRSRTFVSTSATAAAVPAGTVISYPLPSGVKLQQYLGVGILSTAADLSDGGTWSAWLDIDPIQTNVTYVENYNWVA